MPRVWSARNACKHVGTHTFRGRGRDCKKQRATEMPDRASGFGRVAETWPERYRGPRISPTTFEGSSGISAAGGIFLAGTLPFAGPVKNTWIFVATPIPPQSPAKKSITRLLLTSPP